MKMKIKKAKRTKTRNVTKITTKPNWCEDKNNNSMVM